MARADHRGIALLNRDTRASRVLMLDRCSRRVLALATWACSACGITGPSLPANAVRFNPPAVFAKWWALTEQCSGKSRPLESLTWYTAPVVTVGRERYAGYYDPASNRIVLQANWVPYGDLVRHEMLHALLQVDGHPRASFLGSCAGVVNCDQDCISSTDPFVGFGGAVSVVAPDSIDVGVAVDPVSPGSGTDDGFFIVSVTARNPRPSPVIVRLPSQSIFSYDVRGPSGGIEGGVVVFDTSQVVFGPYETKRQLFDFVVGNDLAHLRIPPGSYTVRGSFGRHYSAALTSILVNP